jgi:ABC-type bacteriocin/lantibiotic exporter with double-glycine peptidase domain
VRDIQRKKWEVDVWSPLKAISLEDRDRFTKIIAFVRPYWRKILLVFVLTMTSTLFALAYPLFMKYLIDRVFVGGNTTMLGIVVTAMFLVAVLRYVASAVGGYVNTWVTSRVLLDMRLSLFRHLHQVPLNFFARARVGDMVARINGDIAEVQSIATGSLLTLASSLLTLVGTVGILIWLNWRLFLLSSVLIPISFYVLRHFKPRVRALARKIRDINSDIASFVVETFTGVKFIRSHALEAYVARKFLRKNREQIRQILQFQVVNAVAEGANGLLFAASSLAVLGFGGYLVMNGVMTVGGLIAFEVYQMRIFAPVQNLLSVYLRLQRGRASIDRIFEYLDVGVRVRRVKKARRLGDISGRIEFDRVHFSYLPGREVLHGVDFMLEDGKRYALVGRSGAGKTTVADLMLRLYSPTSGRVLVDGIDLEEVNLRSYIRQVAVVAQDTFILHADVIENISYGLRGVSREDIIRAARTAFVDEFVHGLPDGYETLLGERGFRLSGGQRQRIAIARSVLRSPRILILDEATSSLDWMADQWVQMALKKLMEGRMTLIITHRLNMVRDVQKIFVIEAGKIVEEGTHDGLMSRKGLYATLQSGSGFSPGRRLAEEEKREMVSRMKAAYLEEAQSDIERSGLAG